MTTISIEHIVLDDKGVARIAGGRSKVTQIATDVRNGMSPEMISEAYPHLSLAQIYAALSYYHDHKEELDAQIEQGRRLADSLKSQASPSPTKAELLHRLGHREATSGDNQ
jgi:uncharacterized protein (DUF433 family)